MANNISLTAPVRDLDNLPDGWNDHVWADFLELSCLVDLDGEFSAADLLDKIREGKDVGEASQPPSAISEFAEIEGKDRMGRRAADFFQNIRYRAATFGTTYPFILARNDVLTRVYHHQPSAAQQLYILLLLAANLRYIRQFTQDLTRAFETVSLAAMRALLPVDSEVHFFGKHDSRYQGALLSKVRSLADDLNEACVANEDDFDPHDVGDGGLDLIGWVSPGDDAPGRLLLFAQCACTEEWTGKQYTSSPANWRSYINFTAAPLNIAFIPYCFRTASGSWHRQRWISDSVLVDRERLLRLVREPEQVLQYSGCQEIIQCALTQRELSV